jgi:hypothetical protein
LGASENGNEQFIDITGGELADHSSGLYNTIGTRLSLNNHVRNKSNNFGRKKSQFDKKRNRLTQSSLIPTQQPVQINSPHHPTPNQIKEFRACSGEGKGNYDPSVAQRLRN